MENLTRLLSELLSADHVMVSEVFDHDPKRAHIISFFSGGCHQTSGSYDLQGSPCESVLNSDSCIFNEGVCQSFPDDEMLQTLGAESYIGVPMLTVEGTKLGLLAILNDAPMQYSTDVLALLQVAASQAAAELAQMRFTNHLKESQRQLLTLMDSLPGMAYRCKNDRCWTIEMMSRGVYEVTGYQSEQLLNNNEIAYADLIHPQDRDELDRAIRLAVASDSYFQVNYRIIRADGAVRWVWEQGKGVRSDNGDITHFEGFLRDITEQHLQQQRIAEIAFSDELTGLPNRPALLNFLQREYEQTSAPDLLLVLLDIRGFRAINQRFGLQTGDTLLRVIARQLQAELRKFDQSAFLARITGNEFVVVSANYSAGIGDFLQLADHLTQLFADPIAVHDHQLLLNFKVSGAFSKTAQSGSELLQQASIAMYEAKQNELSYCTFDTDLEQKVSLERRQTERFLRALQNQELTVHLQPQIDLNSKQCLGAEVLCRWFDDELGTVPPDTFIAIARKQGVLPELGWQVLKKTCALIEDWQTRYQQVPPVSVNVGAQQFASADMVDEFVRICGDLPASSIILEITESDLMIDPRQALAVTKRLREYGFELAIDDFGTGYSSLAYLQLFDVDILKIDISFVHAMTLDEQSKTLVNTILVMAKTLGLTTIAEGIETEEQAMLLQKLGCEQGQGFYFARPMSPEEFEKQWLHP
nr:EAL domain-containing protein [Pseudidiomarina sp. 1APP75-32.1]